MRFSRLTAGLLVPLSAAFIFNASPSEAQNQNKYEPEICSGGLSADYNRLAQVRDFTPSDDLTDASKKIIHDFIDGGKYSRQGFILAQKTLAQNIVNSIIDKMQALEHDPRAGLNLYNEYGYDIYQDYACARNAIFVAIRESHASGDSLLISETAEIYSKGLYRIMALSALSQKDVTIRMAELIGAQRDSLIRKDADHESLFLRYAVSNVDELYKIPHRGRAFANYIEDKLKKIDEERYAGIFIDQYHAFVRRDPALTPVILNLFKRFPGSLERIGASFLNMLHPDTDKSLVIASFIELMQDPRTVKGAAKSVLTSEYKTSELRDGILYPSLPYIFEAIKNNERLLADIGRELVTRLDTDHYGDALFRIFARQFLGKDSMTAAWSLRHLADKDPSYTDDVYAIFEQALEEHDWSQKESSIVKQATYHARSYNISAIKKADSERSLAGLSFWIHVVESPDIDLSPYQQDALHQHIEYFEREFNKVDFNAEDRSKIAGKLDELKQAYSNRGYEPEKQGKTFTVLGQPMREDTNIGEHPLTQP